MRADDKRVVAVIDLSATPDAIQLRRALNTALYNHWALQPLGPGIDEALQGDFLDEDADALARARAKRAEAEDDLARFDFQPAANAADDALHALTDATPAAATPASADLAFLAGIAELEQHHPKEAAAHFAFAHRLNPAYAVDPVRYLPEIVDAYKAAAAAAERAARLKLAVTGPGDVWIDGVERGPAGTMNVDAGWHLVQVAGPDLVTTGKLVDVASDQSVEVDAAAAGDGLRVQRARRALSQLPDDAVARAGAMKQLADLLGVHDAVLIWKAGSKLVVQTWRDREPGFSALRARGREPAIELLEPLAPAEPPYVAPAPPQQQILPPAVRVEDEPPWYRRRWVQATVASGVAVTVIGAIVYALQQKTVATNQMAGFTP